VYIFKNEQQLTEVDFGNLTSGNEQVNKFKINLSPDKIKKLEIQPVSTPFN
jgi:hypothetical protein